MPKKDSHQTEKAKQKIREANIGKHLTEETIEKISEALMGNTNGLGYRHTKEEINKMRGRIVSEEYRRNKRKTMMGNTYRLGKYHTKETREKQSKAMRGEKNPMYGKKCKWLIGNIFALGYHRSIETREKHSITISGKNHWNWKGGKPKEPYPLEWTETLKESIRERDGHICQKCGIPQNGRKLDIHHIDHNAENCLSSNLISLCNRCNGKVNFNRKFWEEYLKNKLKGKMIFQK